MFRLQKPGEIFGLSARMDSDSERTSVLNVEGQLPWPLHYNRSKLQAHRIRTAGSVEVAVLLSEPHLYRISLARLAKMTARSTGLKADSLISGASLAGAGKGQSALPSEYIAAALVLPAEVHCPGSPYIIIVVRLGR